MGFSPLDDELALLPSRYTPQVHQALVRLSAWMPFAEAAAILDHLLGVQVTADTARRHTEAAGDAYVAHQTAQVEALLQTSTELPVSEARLLVSADGAMVPLLHGEWAEVKTLAVGEVDAEGHTRALSYFSRLCDAASFTELATVEICRRGVPRAAQVAAVVDGAEWLQGFLDVQCPQAVRILDFPHAAQRVAALGQVLIADEAARAEWLRCQLQTLKHEGPQPVLTTLQELIGADGERTEAASEDLGYLASRVEQMQYAAFQAADWPIGSGVVESANKLVVEARLKGAGMHWAREHVNGMVALRTVVCSGRWAEGWRAVSAELRQQEQRERLRRRRQRQARRAPREAACEVVRQEGAQAGVAVEVLRAAVAEDTAQVHPWRRAWSVRRQTQEAELRSHARL